jgi:hypothetical protein
MQDADKNPSIIDFMSNIKSSQELSDMFENIQKDATDALTVNESTNNAASMDVN